MSNEKWSEWKPWSGGECPLQPTDLVEAKTLDGLTEKGDPEAFYWGHDGAEYDIIAYRYKIKEPESDMHPDLEWLARNVSRWGFENHRYIQMGEKTDKGTPTVTYSNQKCLNSYAKPQWQAARQQLGLDQLEVTEAEEEAWQAKERELIGGPRKAENFLMQAAELLAERGKQYDQPGGERSMGKTMGAFNIITGRDLTEAEGWLIMTLLKRVRQYSGQGYHKDSAEDGVTYGALEAEALESAG